jgi:uncharacterized protein YprB with RNaseH-like and TPR domain
MRLQDLQQYGVLERPVPAVVSRGTGIRHLLDGAIVDLPGGDCFYRESRFELTDQHGLHSLSQVQRLSGHRLGIISKDVELSYADLSRAVFLDTETTGLGMGAGTYVFLVGAGFLEGEQFHVRQYFLSGPGHELSLLRALHDFLSSFPAIVTFNGKAFDWPLLESRFLRHRRRPPLDDPPHLDLIHPARRLWKRRLESCALSSLEREILAVRRSGEDVPGYEIPARYFLYQRSGDGAALAGVFYHNLLDILSLAALAVHVDLLLSDPFGGLLTDPIDFVSFGRVAERADQPDLAVACYEEGLRLGLQPAERADCLSRLGALHKRQRAWESALQSWDLMVDHGGEPALQALVEIAKYYEHVERDYLQAMDAVRHALMLAELRGQADTDVELAELEHRLGRLLARAARSRGGPRTRV